MRYLNNENDTQIVKHGDTSEVIRLSARNDNDPVTWTDKDCATVHIDTINKVIPATLIVGSNNVTIDSADLADIPAGSYGIELWVELDGKKTAIWPSDATLQLTISKNADEITGDVVSTVTLEQFRKEIDNKVADAVKSVHIDPSTVSIDLSDYAKKTDIPVVPKIALDVDNRVLFINSQQITIPASVDLSQYAKKSDVPSVTYDPTTKTLTVDGQAVKLSADVDLSNYYDKAEIDNKLVNLNANKPIDLTAYVRKEDLADYARKSDIPSVPKAVLDTQKRTITVDGQEIDIPNTVDLSQYAKKDDVPKVALDASARKITIGDASINVPDAVDLSSYLTEQEADAKYAKKSDVENANKGNSGTVHVYKTDVDVPNTMRNQSGIGFDKLQCVFTGYTVNDAKVGDVVIDTTGSAYKVNRMYYQEVAVEKTPILKGNSLTKLSDFDKTQTQQMSIIAKEKVKDFLQMNDTDAYTLNVDECTLTNNTTKTTTKLVPAVYPLRDLNISNLSIKSNTNFGLKDGVRCNPVQLTITPYAVFANVVTSDYSVGGTGTTEQMFWHPVWIYDISEWYGITAAWHKLP